VAGDGGTADEEAGGDSRVAESLGDKLGDLELAGRELAVAMPISGCSYTDGAEDALGAFDAAGGTDGVERVAGGDRPVGVAEQFGAPAANEGVEPGPGCGSCQLFGVTPESTSSRPSDGQG
jgi:hypothetical protein